jgi:hypothetical protein
MNTNPNNAGIDMKTRLSTLWLFATLNYLYCDVVTVMDPQKLKQFYAGTVGGMEITQGFLLGAGVLVEIPIAMILLSRILKYPLNRWANIIAGLIMTIVQILTLFSSSPAIYYIFFSIIEIASTSLIVWYAWKWSRPAVEDLPVEHGAHQAAVDVKS